MGYKLFGLMNINTLSGYQVSILPHLADVMNQRINYGNSEKQEVSNPTWTQKLSPFKKFCNDSTDDRLGYIAYTENGTLMCTKCGNRFTTKQGLMEHIKRHKGIHRYYCDICHKGFRMKGHFEGHMNAHLNVRPYQCHNCEKTFSYKHSYLRHLSSCDSKRI